MRDVCCDECVRCVWSCGLVLVYEDVFVSVWVEVVI